MLKLSWLLFALGFHYMSVSFTIETNGISETNLKCPPSALVGTTCRCDDMTSSIHCNGATYRDMEIFFDELKSANTDGVHVHLFRMDNYTNTTLDVIIFTPCTGNDTILFCDERVELTFVTIDLRGNKDLKHVGSKFYLEADIDRINARNLLLSNCSLNEYDDTGIYNFFYNGLSMFGSALEHFDLSQNYLSSIQFRYGILNWPNLQIFNISKNKINYFDSGAFVTIPNVDIIDLSHNFIQHIPSRAFEMNNPYPHKMEMEIIIDLSNNFFIQNSIFHETMFTFLRRPTKLLLSQNNFNHLPQLSFESLINRPSALIDMSNNPLICDCQSEWLRSKALIYESRMINYECLNLNNISIFQIEESLCENYCC